MLIEDPAALADYDTVSATVKLYAKNHTLLRTLSLPDPIVVDDSKGISANLVSGYEQYT